MPNIFYPALTWRLSISGLPYRTRIPQVRGRHPGPGYTILWVDNHYMICIL
jgi:hypothetical protein